jgi:hypothetical protein
MTCITIAYVIEHNVKKPFMYSTHRTCNIIYIWLILLDDICSMLFYSIWRLKSVDHVYSRTVKNYALIMNSSELCLQMLPLLSDIPVV